MEFGLCLGNVELGDIVVMFFGLGVLYVIRFVGFDGDGNLFIMGFCGRGICLFVDEWLVFWKDLWFWKFWDIED